MASVLTTNFLPAPLMFRPRGDACHPMLPYLAMGANSALEDGCVLGRLLRYVTSREQVPLALDLYQRLRKARGEAIARETFQQVSGVKSLCRWVAVLY